MKFFSPRSSVFLADPTCKAQVTGGNDGGFDFGFSFVFRCGDGGIRQFVFNVTIGKDILQKHKQITLKFNGSKDELIVGAVKSSGTFPALRAAPLPLFTNVNCDIKPIATLSRRYSPVDSAFISKEVVHVLGEGIIEPSVSPWQVQLLVVLGENHKKHLVIDYNNTINLYTELDAYTMPNITDMINNIAQYKYWRVHIINYQSKMVTKNIQPLKHMGNVSHLMSPIVLVYSRGQVIG